MNGKDLLELKEGRMSFATFFKKHRHRMERMATYFFNRARWAHLPIDVGDLVQLGATACWQGVQDYWYRCSVCKRWAASKAELQAHAAIRHAGVAVRADPSLYQWGFGRVGSAMDHEVTRYVRREKFVGEALHRHLADELL